ncbi:GumC family protein [Cochlodiniinecator piscidefendens]|uniref:GumC family protein n=1 Tax=Cochlodiniinecator piscidefendens TaxID=2715756 RepID=UPI00140E781C|nr:polysaccharide biosynthesis tyrosine autokinase [Cochlodiniinecator piscidefendens]
MTNTTIHTGVQPEADEIDLRLILSTIWRGKWIITLCFSFCVILGGYYAYKIAVPTYSASTIVILESRQEQVLDLESVIGGLSGDTSVINSEVEVLRSRNLMKQVVLALDLTNDPEFNTELRTPSGFQSFTSQLRTTLLGNPTTIELTPEEEEDRIINNTVSALLEATSVNNVRQSLVFRISATTEHAAKSALIANTIAQRYILNQLEVKQDATEQAVRWLTERVTELRVELENAEAAVTDFNANTELVSSEALQALERQVKETRDRISGALETKSTIETRLLALRNALTPEAQLEVANSPQLNRTYQLLQNGTIDQDIYRSQFDAIVSRVEMDFTRATTQLELLQTSEHELVIQIERQNGDLITLRQLTREADASGLLYELFQSRLNETAALRGIQQADSRILSDSVRPSNPIAPRKSLILALSGILGVLLGAVIVLVRELGQNTFRTISELQKATGRTVMGQIPLLPASKRRDAIDYLAKRPTSAAAEAVRNLRTSVMLSNIDNPPQVVVVTSSLPGEGKTTVSLAFAQNLVGLGKKVLLIEGDIRRRIFGQYLDNKDALGLLAVLEGKATLEECVLEDPRIQADILIGEETKVNATDIFSSQKFKDFLEEARKVYDYIIIDTPPVLVVPDARVIGQAGDALLFVVKWDQTSKVQVDEALRMLDTVNLDVTGLVMSQVNAKGMKRYGYAGQYGAYGSYGDKYYHN